MERRQTRQKAAIRDAFLVSDRPLSAEEALRAAQRHHRKLGIATLYRNIQSLLEDEWLQPVEVPGDKTRYEVAGKEHHHHFHAKSAANCSISKGALRS